MEPINPVTAAEVGTVAQEAANIASVATANPTYAAEAALGVTLGNAMVTLYNAISTPAPGTVTQSEWSAMGAGLGAALAAYHTAK